MGRVCAAAVVAILAWAAPAWAEGTITAVPANDFSAAVTTIDQGEKVVLQNLDVVAHDAASRARGSDGKPLFASELIQAGQSGPVPGTEYLASGLYDFICTVHPGMEAKLEVTSAGKPVPRPGDKPPRVSVAITSKSRRAVAKSGLVLRVRSNEAATVKLSATAVADGKRLKLGGHSVGLTRAGSHEAVLKLSKSVRKTLGSARKVTISVSASAKDSAGKTARASAKRTLG